MKLDTLNHVPVRFQDEEPADAGGKYELPPEAIAALDIVEAEAAERLNAYRPEPRGDAIPAAQEEVVADEPSGDEPAETADDAIPSEVEALQKAYDLDPELIGDWKDAASLQRALDLSDRLAYREYRERQAQEQPTEQPAQPAEQPQTTAQVEPPKPGDDPFDAMLSKVQELGYEAELQEPLKLLRKLHGESQAEIGELKKNIGTLAQILYGERQAQAEAARAHEIDTLLKLADELKAPELFGVDGTPASDDVFKNLKALQDAVHGLQERHYRNTGRPLPLTKATVERAYRSAFGDHYETKLRKEVAAKATTQARKRMGVGLTNKPKLPETWNGDPENDPVLLAKYSGFVKENGG